MEQSGKIADKQPIADRQPIMEEILNNLGNLVGNSLEFSCYLENKIYTIHNPMIPEEPEAKGEREIYTLVEKLSFLTEQLSFVVSKNQKSKERLDEIF